MEELQLPSKENELEQATSESNEHLKGKRCIIKNVCVLGIGFLLTFTAYGSLEKLQSSLYSDERLGLVSLIVIYTAFGLSCLFVPTILINKLGCKYSLMLAMGGVVTFTIANFYPRYWTLLPTSAITGKECFTFI